MSIVALGLAALIAVGAAAPVASPDRRSTPASTPADLPTLNTRLQAQLQADNYLGALATLKLMEAHPDFALLPEAGRNGVELLLGILHGDQGAWAVARPYLERVVARPNAPAIAWQNLLTAQAATDDMNAAARTLTQMATRQPSMLDELNPEFVESLAGWRDVDDDTAFAVRLALHRANWSSDGDSYLWLKLVDDLLTRDRLAEAAQVAPKIDGFGSRLTLFSLRRYDAVRATAGLDDADIQGSFQRDQDAQRRRAEAADSSARDRAQWAMEVYSAGRYADALALADAGLATPPAEDSEDEDDHRWFLDVKRRALYALGRYDEALAEGRTAHETAGDDKVSFAINLGSMLVRLDRPAEALAVLPPSDTDDASPYGLMQSASVRSCAGHALGAGDAAGVGQAAQDYLAEHWRDAPAAYMEGLACRGDVEGVAALYVRRLADAELAGAAVTELHDYLPQPPGTSVDARIYAVWAEAVARPEVIVARDAVGYGFTVPTIGPTF